MLHSIFLSRLIGAEVTVKVQTLVELHRTEDPPVIHHLMQKQKLKLTDLEKQSIGYETMTTSDVDSEVSFRMTQNY